MPLAKAVLMVRPAHFGFNEETAASNKFQERLSLSPEEIRQAAIREFDDYVALLRQEGVDVLVVQDTPEPKTPDAIFPNNWITTHSDGTVVIHPMCTPNRRAEKFKNVLPELKAVYKVLDVADMSHLEERGQFLEGTGSLVFNSTRTCLFGLMSPRTSNMAVRAFLQEVPVKNSILFTAVDKDRIPIYHTNVMLSIGRRFAVVCTEALVDQIQRSLVLRKLREDGLDVIEINLQQMGKFAANCLHVENRSGEDLIIMSATGWNSLDEKQQEAFKKHGKMVLPRIETIERIGGGSARCMLAEIMLARR